MSGAIEPSWAVSTVGAQFDIQLGKMLDAARNTGQPKSYLGNRAVQWDSIDISAAGLVPMTRIDQQRYRLREGDLLVCEGGEVGRAAIWRGELPECYFQKALHRLRPKTGYSVRLMLALLEYWASVGTFSNFVTQTSIAHLPREKFVQIPLPVPEASEQKRLSDLLDDVHEEIATLERLIAKKQAIKQGMMQQRFALPDDGEHHAQLGTLVTFLSGGTPDRSNAEYWSGSIPWISATTLKHIEVSTSDQSVTDRAVRAGSRMAPLQSTLVLVRGSALHSEIRASLVTAPVCFNQDVKALVPSTRLEPKFLTYSIHANASKLLSLVTSAGNTAGVLDTKVLKSFEIWHPDRDTQRQIISVFDAVARELEVLTARLDKAKAVKQGMMQQLLTGRTRLPVQEAAA